MGVFDVIVEDGKAIFTKKPYVTKAQRAAAEVSGDKAEGSDEVKATEAAPSPPVGPTDPKPGSRQIPNTPPAEPQT